MRLALALLLLDAMFVAPQWLYASMGEGKPAGWVALEAAVVVGLLALLPRRGWAVALAWVAALLAVLGTVVALADAVFQISLARSFDLFLDAYLASAVWLLAVGNLGLARTVVAALVLVVALGFLTFALARLLAPPRGDRPRPGRRLAGTALLVAAAWLALHPPAAIRARVGTPVVSLARAQVERFRATRGERERFASELEARPDRDAREMPGLLSKLGGDDVLLTFIESYGMAAIEDPEFAAVVKPRLDTLAARVAAAGLHMATGVLDSPTQGGQSWLAHGTAMSGLWLDSQLRYDLLMASDRQTLVDDFRAAGYRTVALMPAITSAWPEGARLGYDEVFTLPDIPYSGPPLYWVTMPDQFTLSFVERALLGRGETPRTGRAHLAAAGTGGEEDEAPNTHAADPDARPLFAEIALVSSHAPWTPILPMIPWDSVGDGSVFAPYEREGHPPEELWVDPDRLREAYPRSIDYSLQAVADFAVRDVDERTLLIVLGDHQAAPWVTGASSASVPVHVITGDPERLEPFLRWGFREGALPDAERRPIGMDELRDWLVRAFSGALEARAAQTGGSDGR